MFLNLRALKFFIPFVFGCFVFSAYAQTDDAFDNGAGATHTPPSSIVAPSPVLPLGPYTTSFVQPSSRSLVVRGCDHIEDSGRSFLLMWSAFDWSNDLEKLYHFSHHEDSFDVGDQATASLISFQPNANVLDIIPHWLLEHKLSKLASLVSSAQPNENVMPSALGGNIQFSLSWQGVMSNDGRELWDFIIRSDFRDGNHIHIKGRFCADVGHALLIHDHQSAFIGFVVPQ